jgi:hypothetical protein
VSKKSFKEPKIEERTSTEELVGEILLEGRFFKPLQDKRSRSTQEKKNHSRPSHLGEVVQWLARESFESSQIGRFEV